MYAIVTKQRMKSAHLHKKQFLNNTCRHFYLCHSHSYSSIRDDGRNSVFYTEKQEYLQIASQE